MKNLAVKNFEEFEDLKPGMLLTINTKTKHRLIHL